MRCNMPVYPVLRFRAQLRLAHSHPRERMPNDLNRFYASALMQTLFARELSALAPVLAGIYGNHGLFLRAHAAAPVALPPHLLGTMTELAVAADGRFEGSVSCELAELPFASESFKLLIVQHAFERIDHVQACAVELARVLAPEGVVLILGFNPLGSWRPWLASRAAGGSRLRLRSARACQRLLAGEQIDTLQVRYPGVFWPRACAIGQTPTRIETLLARFGSSWLLLARKRRSTLTPLRLRSGKRELALNPRLLPGAHRECA